MLESFPMVLLTGTVLGFLTGLGIGGGSLLILWLTMVLEMEQQIARGINLLFFLPAAVIACVFRLKQGKLKLRPVIPAMLAGCAAAVFFSWLASKIDVETLKTWFGAVLIAAGIRELLYRPRKAR